MKKLLFCLCVLLAVFAAAGCAGKSVDGGSVVLKDNVLTASYQKIDARDGGCSLQFNMTNNTTVPIKVVLAKALINGTPVTVESATAEAIESGKNADESFILSFGQSDITSVDQIESLTLQFNVLSEEGTMIEESGDVTIDIK